MKQIAIDIEPMITFPGKAAALVKPCGRTATNAIARDEFDFSRVRTCNTRVDDLESQPLLVTIKGH